MAVQLSKEIRKTGVTSDHWVLVSMSVDRVETTNTFTLTGVYALWKDSIAYDNGKKPIPGQRVVVTTGSLQGNPTASQMQATLDAAAVDVGAPLSGGSVV